MRFQAFCVGLCFLSTAFCFADDLPSYERSAVRRYQSGLESMLGKAERDFQKLQESLVRKQEFAKNKGDLKTVEAINAELKKLAEQLEQLKGVLGGGEDGGQIGNGEAVADARGEMEKKDEAIVASRLVKIQGNSRVGTFLGAMPAGTVITLQYVSGMWSNGTATGSPDSHNDPWLQLLIAGTSRKNDIRDKSLVIVPHETAISPFSYKLELDCERVTLRMSDHENWFQENQGAVTYRVSISKKP